MDIGASFGEMLAMVKGVCCWERVGLDGALNGDDAFDWRSWWPALASSRMGCNVFELGRMNLELAGLCRGGLAIWVSTVAKSLSMVMVPGSPC